MKQIQALRTEQIPEAADLWLRSVTLGHPFIDEAYWRAQYDRVKTDDLPGSKTYGFYSGKKMRGFLSVIKGNTIGALFVDIDCQGKGIGSSLLEFAKSKFAVLHLNVYQNNTHALTFYLKHGFVPDDQRVDPETGEVEYTMTWRGV